VTIYIPEMLLRITSYAIVCVFFVFTWACILHLAIWSYARWAKSVKLFNAIRVYISLKLYNPDHKAINDFMRETIEEWVSGSVTRYWSLRGIVERAAALYPEPERDDCDGIKEIAKWYNYEDVESLSPSSAKDLSVAPSSSACKSGEQSTTNDLPSA
jgi:hypothetical protein